MVLVGRNEELRAKEFDDIDELLKWVDKNKRHIDIVNISYSRSRIVYQPVCVLWFKTKMGSDVK